MPAGNVISLFTALYDALTVCGVKFQRQRSTGLPCFRRPADLAIPWQLFRAAKACHPSWFISWKPRVEFALAFVGLVLTAPVIFLAALLIKLTSRGPAIYTQVRIGENGRPRRFPKESEDH